MKAYDRYRYSQIIPTDADAPAHFGIRPPVQIPESDGDSYHTVTDGDRIDTLAWKYYKNPHYGWIIAEANDISRPWELKAGAVLRIPSPQTVEMNIVD